MKRFLTILLGVLLIAAMTVPAFAWEFAMTGETEYRYRYFARQGSADLFGGPAGFNAAGIATRTIGFAGPMGGAVLVQGFSAKGGDASIQDNRVWLYPQIRINPAIRLRGEYWLTGSNLRGSYSVSGGASDPNNWIQPNGYNGWYISNDGTPGNGPTPSGMSVGLWEKCWVTVQLPWGVFAAGRRPASFGLGWESFGERDIDSESIFLVVPYGPLNFGMAVYPRDNGGDAFNENEATTIATNVLFAGGTDKNRVRNSKLIFFTYHNGPVDLGSLVIYIPKNDAHFLTTGFATVPAGPAGRDDPSSDAFPALYLTARHLNSTATPIYGDPNWLLWPSYFKYNNGRFFFNAMYAFEYADVRRKGGRPISTWADAWELEFGAMCGPAKLTFAGFYHSGDDRRGGWLNVTNATGRLGNTFVYDRQTRFVVLGGAQQAILPYQFLLGIYGSGNNSYDRRGYCQFLDFLAYASRLDYAVAANLNVFGSFIYAMRASNTATPIASFRGGIPNVGAGAFRVSPGFTGTNGAQNAAVPNVPDNYLGWEADVGFNWKLLEGLTFNTLFAYWQPGDWFKYAYVDFGSRNVASINRIAYPINPNRAIDPMIGFQGSVVVDF